MQSMRVQVRNVENEMPTMIARRRILRMVSSRSGRWLTSVKYRVSPAFARIVGPTGMPL